MGDISHDYDEDEKRCDCGSDVLVVVEVVCEQAGQHLWQEEVGYEAASNAGLIP